MKTEPDPQSVDLSPVLDGAKQPADFAELFAYLASAAREAGFSAFAFIALPAAAQGSLRESVVFADMPDGFLDAYDETQPLKTAPMWTRLRTSSAPQRWSLGADAATQPVDPTVANVELLSNFGLEAGLSVPVSCSDGSRAVMCFFGARAPIGERLMADLTLCSILAYDTYCRLKAQPAQDTVKLSDREVQVLGWAASGKTSVEIATILSLSDHTVNSYLNSAMRKMDCVNRTQLVAKALRLHIIS